MVGILSVGLRGFQYGEGPSEERPRRGCCANKTTSPMWTRTLSGRRRCRWRRRRTRADMVRGVSSGHAVTGKDGEGGTLGLEHSLRECTWPSPHEVPDFVPSAIVPLRDHLVMRIARLTRRSLRHLPEPGTRFTHLRPVRSRLMLFAATQGKDKRKSEGEGKRQRTRALRKLTRSSERSQSVSAARSSARRGV